MGIPSYTNQFEEKNKAEASGSEADFTPDAKKSRKNCKVLQGSSGNEKSSPV